MIIDTLASADRYVGLHSLFTKAFEYIKGESAPISQFFKTPKIEFSGISNTYLKICP